MSDDKPKPIEPRDFTEHEYTALEALSEFKLYSPTSPATINRHRRILANGMQNAYAKHWRDRHRWSLLLSSRADDYRRTHELYWKKLEDPCVATFTLPCNEYIIGAIEHLNSRMKRLYEIAAMQGQDLAHLFGLYNGLNLDYLPREGLSRKNQIVPSAPTPRSDITGWTKDFDHDATALFELLMSRTNSIGRLHEAMAHDGLIYAASYLAFNDPKCTKENADNPVTPKPYFLDDKYPENNKSEAQAEMQYPEMPELPESSEGQCWAIWADRYRFNQLTKILLDHRFHIIEAQNRLAVLSQSIKLLNTKDTGQDLRRQLLEVGRKKGTEFPQEFWKKRLWGSDPWE